MFKKKFPSLSSLGSDGNTAFLRAARAGNLDKVLEHLKANIDINTSNSNGLNALHLASKDGHIHVVTELLKRGASVDAATKKGNTALHIASLAGQEEVVKLLVANGAAVNVQSQNGFTPLYMAAQENHDSVVRFLLANGANQSLATEDGFTPLAVAMQQGHDKVVAVLLENDTRGKVRLPALHIAAKKDDCKAAALLLQNDHNPDVTSKSGFTPLHIAAHYGNENIANLLLNRGADVNYAAKHNITPLHVAAKWGKTNMVSLLLEKGANIESKTRDGLTPLHCAARSGHEQVVDMLLERAAPISSKTKNGLAPLHMASQGDHVDAARILLYHRAPVDEVTVDYLTALHVAAHCGHVRVAKLLLDRKADPNARALNGFTPLHIACKKNRIKVVELLLKHGASIEATTESGLTPLHVASFMGCMNIVIYLLQHDANPDMPTVRGETPLHLAARANQTDIIRILLRNGAQVDARAREQQTPLHIASRLGNVDIVMLLLQHGAAVDSTTKDLYTALHIAAKEGQEEVASVLLEHGASLTATTKKGFTPLHLAAKYGNMKVAKLLLQRDAPVDAQGKNGVTPLHVASHYDHQNVALLLLDKGASPHATAKNGHTPLHIAARKNQMDIATTLLEFGAKANAESKAGFTPLHLSSQEGHTDMSTLLIEHQADTNHKAKNGLTPLHLCAQEDQVNVASILVKNGAEVDSTTKAGYTPLHVASHFGQSNMVRFLLQHGVDVKASTSIGYTPLHQAAQQGHATIVNLLLENGAQPNALTSQGQSPLSIAQKLGYISVVESLKVVTDPSVLTNGMPGTDEKYRVVAPETMQETFMSDSEDEGGEDTMLSDQPYRYLTVDEMKSLGDDSLPIDVTRDERMDSNRETMAPPTAVDDTISPQHTKESYQQFAVNYTPDNIDIARHPIHVGFLVSFLVDARGGAMRGCRHSGVRVIVPPRKAAMPTRVTCRYLKRDKLTHPPPLMEGEALASRILELGPVGAKFLGPVIIEVPHFGSLRGMEREIVILRSDNGEMWREHTLEANDEAVQQVLNESFEGEELDALEEVNAGRTTRILTTDFPQYFAVVSRIRQEVHAIGPDGGMVSSSVVPQVQAVFPQGALTKKIKVGLQAQPIPTELTAKLLGNRVAVSPIVTVEPRRRKFHKPITLTLPVPQAANKGMINQYSGDAPTLRLLCSITGGTTRAQWEDVTGSTPLTFVNDCVSFTTTVSARFWLMDCRNIGEATKMATELYKEAMHVPFMAKFVVFAKRVDQLEARLRVFCMTDDKEDKTLENQEQFTEVAKSRDVEVLEGKSQYVEFAGNLVPVTKSGDQLQLGFRAFRENRLPFTVRVKDPHADTVGRILFMREPKVAKGEPPQQPICILNIVLPETIMPESGVSEPDLIALHKKYSFLRDGGLVLTPGRPDMYQRTDLRLSDISNLLGEDWVRLATELGVTTSDVNSIKSEHPGSVAQQAMAMLRLWLQQAGNKATGNTLETALRKLNREDIVQQCIFNVDEKDRAVAKARLDQSGFESLKEELGPSRDISLRRDTSLDITYDEQDIMKDSESVEELVLAEKKEPYQDKKITDVPISAKMKEEKQKTDVDETKYIGEEKVVEEERRSVSELKEIFAQDKRDRQYERQPRPVVEEEAKEMPPASPPVTQDTSRKTVTTTTTTPDGSRVTKTTTTTTIEHIKKITDEVPERLKDIDTSETIPSPPKPVFKASEADQRRDSELFQGVTEELARLETTYKVTPAPEGPEVMSPKVSKTPPPSPAEFKDPTGVMTWHPSDQVTSSTTTTTTTTTRITTTKTTSAQPVSSEDWTEKSQDQDSDVSQGISGTLEHGDDQYKHHYLPISTVKQKLPVDIEQDIYKQTSMEQQLISSGDTAHFVQSSDHIVLPFSESLSDSADIISDLPLNVALKKLDTTQTKSVNFAEDFRNKISDVDLDGFTTEGQFNTKLPKKDVTDNVTPTVDAADKDDKSITQVKALTKSEQFDNTKKAAEDNVHEQRTDTSPIIVGEGKNIESSKDIKGTDVSQVFGTPMKDLKGDLYFTEVDTTKQLETAKEDTEVEINKKTTVRHGFDKKVDDPSQISESLVEDVKQVADITGDLEVSKKDINVTLHKKVPDISQTLQTIVKDIEHYTDKEFVDFKLPVIPQVSKVTEKDMNEVVVEKKTGIVSISKEKAEDPKESITEKEPDESQIFVDVEQNLSSDTDIKETSPSQIFGDAADNMTGGVQQKVNELTKMGSEAEKYIKGILDDGHAEKDLMEEAGVCQFIPLTETNIREGVDKIWGDVEKDVKPVLCKKQIDIPQTTKDAGKGVYVSTCEKVIDLPQMLESTGPNIKQVADVKGTDISMTLEAVENDIRDITDKKLTDFSQICGDARKDVKTFVDKTENNYPQVLGDMGKIMKESTCEGTSVFTDEFHNARKDIKKVIDKKVTTVGKDILCDKEKTDPKHIFESIQKDVPEVVNNKALDALQIIGAAENTIDNAADTHIFPTAPVNWEGEDNSSKFNIVCEEINDEVDKNNADIYEKCLITISDSKEPADKKLEEISQKHVPPLTKNNADTLKPSSFYEIKSVTQNFIDAESLAPHIITEVGDDYDKGSVLPTSSSEMKCEDSVKTTGNFKEGSSGKEFVDLNTKDVEKKQVVRPTDISEKEIEFENKYMKPEDVTLKKSKIMLQDMKDDIADILKEIADEQPVAEQARESIPVITTPTTQRRGTQSMRLSKEKRPPPLDVTHLVADEGDYDDDDDAYDSYGYIVTEPCDGTSKKPGPKVTHVSSSPDILAGLRPLSQTVLIDCATKAAADLANLLPGKRKPMFHIESEEDEISEQISSANIGPTKDDTRITPTSHESENLFSEVADVSELAEKVAEQVQSEIKGKGKIYEDSQLAATSLTSDDQLENLFTTLEEKTSKSLDFATDPPTLPSAEELVKEEKKARRVERRFERMASETLKSDAIEGSTPEVEQQREDEFQRMVSQLSMEEVDDCQKEYTQLWDEGGLTPSEDWDSRDPDTPSGELDDDTTPSEVNMNKLDTVDQPAPPCKIVDIPKIVIESCETASAQSQDDESFDPFELYFTAQYNEHKEDDDQDYDDKCEGVECVEKEQTDFDKLFENVSPAPNHLISDYRNTGIGHMSAVSDDISHRGTEVGPFTSYDGTCEPTKGSVVKSNAEHMALDILEEALAESIILQNTEDADRIEMIEWMLKDVAGTSSCQRVRTHEPHIKRELCSIERSPLGDLATSGWDQQHSHHDPQVSTPAREEEEDAVTVHEGASTGPQTTQTTTRVVSDDGTLTTTTTTRTMTTSQGDDSQLQELLKRLEEEKQARH